MDKPSLANVVKHSLENIAPDYLPMLTEILKETSQTNIKSQESQPLYLDDTSVSNSSFIGIKNDGPQLENTNVMEHVTTATATASANIIFISVILMVIIVFLCYGAFRKNENAKRIRKGGMRSYILKEIHKPPTPLKLPSPPYS